MKTLNIIILSMGFLSQTSHAGENQHIIGADLTYGSLDINFKQVATDLGDESGFDIYYRYMLNPFIGVEGGWTSAEGSIGSFLISQVSDVKDVSYSGPNAKIVFQYPIIADSFVYTKLGVNYYNVDYTFNKNEFDESHIGYEASIGLGTRFDFGLGFNLGYRYLDNKLVSSNQVVLGANFAF